MGSTGAYDTTGVSDDDVFDAWAQVANTISEHEPVHMLSHPGQPRYAENYRCITCAFEIDDAWMRDSGPTNASDQGLGGVDWVFNGQGDTAFDWRQDAKVASHIIELTVPNVLDRTW